MDIILKTKTKNQMINQRDFKYFFICILFLNLQNSFPLVWFINLIDYIL